MKYISRLLFLTRQIHVNPINFFLSLKALPNYIHDIYSFKRLANNDFGINYYPCLLDKHESAADLGEYFWQDLFVAKRIIEGNPKRHVDVGSRVDGFIAHLACVREVEILDIRSLQLKISNVKFTQGDITKPTTLQNGIADCVSCLHTLEHVGLGRYGDSIDPDGWRKGLSSLARLLKTGGELWLSVPLGKQRIEFNAHRIFAPRTIHDECVANSLKLVEFHYLENNILEESKNFHYDFYRLRESNYVLGIFRLILEDA
jgi:SAM-dependent methyltransferase